MQTATAFKTTTKPLLIEKKRAQVAEKPISWSAFQSRYLKREDRFKYEWVNGMVEKTARNMDQSQFFILLNLRRHFNSLVFSKKITGSLEAEIDSFFLDKIHRRPDVSYFTADQETAMANGIAQIPAFVIEIVSNNDQMNRLFKKMQNYRDAKVKVVWVILPNLEEVQVFHGENLLEMRVCKGAAICSATPILPDFALTAAEVFNKPKD